MGLIVSLMSMKMAANMYVILSEVMPSYSYPASLINQFEILNDSSC